MPLQLATIHALGERNLLFRREQRHTANLAQVHAHGIVEVAFHIARQRGEALAELIPLVATSGFRLILGHSPGTLRRVERVDCHSIILYLEQVAEGVFVSTNVDIVLFGNGRAEGIARRERERIIALQILVILVHIAHQHR